MKTSEFASLLKQHPETPLYFEYSPGQYVRPDYHITEVKNVDFDTVDCGGESNKWRETHVQLWESELPDPNHAVNTSKAVKIFESVERIRPTYQDTEVKFEYGNANFTTAILPVAGIETDDEKLIVRLGTEKTSCKPKDRASSGQEDTQACCGAAPVKQNIPLELIQENTSTPTGSCC